MLSFRALASDPGEEVAQATGHENPEEAQRSFALVDEGVFPVRGEIQRGAGLHGMGLTFDDGGTFPFDHENEFFVRVMGVLANPPPGCDLLNARLEGRDGRVPVVGDVSLDETVRRYRLPVALRLVRLDRKGCGCGCFAHLFVSPERCLKVPAGSGSILT